MEVQATVEHAAHDTSDGIQTEVVITKIYANHSASDNIP